MGHRIPAQSEALGTRYPPLLAFWRNAACVTARPPATASLRTCQNRSELIEAGHRDVMVRGARLRESSPAGTMGTSLAHPVATGCRCALRQQW